MNERTILADLHLDTPLHIGTGKGADPTDSPLRRSGDGHILLPGRAIGGALRTIATRLAPRLDYRACKALWSTVKLEEERKKSSERKVVPCRCPVCQIFGELFPSDSDAGDKGGEASHIWISDAYAQSQGLSKEPQTHVRDGVGLGRGSRTAARHVKFDQEIVPAGTIFKVRISLREEDPARSEAWANLLAAALGEWEAGRGRLGGSAARGLGAFTLENIKTLRQEVNTPLDLIRYLKSDAPWMLGKADPTWLQQGLDRARQKLVSAQSLDLPVAGGFVTIAFTLVFDGLSLFNDPLSAALTGFDHAPQLTLEVGGEGQPVLPGSSLRGALRSRAEKIARTLATIDIPDMKGFLDRCPVCDPLANHPRLPLASCDSRLTADNEEETAAEDLCLGCRLFGSPRRGSRLWIDDAHWAGPILDKSSWKVQDFLAIDRFTGGGQEGAKFDAAPLVGAKFTARLILNDPQAWELGWLALTLRDLAEGQIPLGFGAAKGYGQAHIDAFDYSLGYLTKDDIPGAEIYLKEGDFSGVYRLTRLSESKLKELMQAWVAEFHQTLKDYTPGKKLVGLLRDSFFDENGQLLTLYGRPSSGR